jgi:hypothetical protein
MRRRPTLAGMVLRRGLIAALVILTSLLAAGAWFLL